MPIVTRIVPPEMKDLPRMLEIEARSFSSPWESEMFVQALHSPGVSGVLLETIQTYRLSKYVRREIIGFLIYRNEKSRLDVWNLAVDPKHRGRGCGTILIDHLKQRLSRGRRHSIRALVGEYNLLGQVFLRSCDFRCEKVVHRCCNAPYADMDAYSMEYWKPFIPRNRLQFGGFANAADV